MQFDFVNIVTRVSENETNSDNRGSTLTENDDVVVDLHEEIVFEEHVADYGKQVDQNESQDCS